MSSETFWHLQSALYAKLTENSPLCALLAAGAGSVYDSVPPDAAFPYIVIGAMQSAPEDTQTTEAHDIRLTLHIYSREDGQREAKRIMAACADALEDGALNVAGHVVVLCRQTGTVCGLAADGRTRHAQMEYRLMVEPVV